MRKNFTDEELLDLVQKNQDASVTPGAEIQDVVNSRDEVIGSLPRDLIWDLGMQGYTRAVNIFVLNQRGQILLPVRSQEKHYLPGGFDYSCGENVFSGETYEQAAIRGLKEELDIHLDSLDKGVYLKRNEPKGLFCFTTNYKFQVDPSKTRINFNKQEIDRLEWKTPSEIIKLYEAYPNKFKQDYVAIFTAVFGIDSSLT